MLALVVAGGVYLAAHLPKHVSLAPTTTLKVALAALGVLVNLYLLSQIKGFDWEKFFLVAKWTLLAYGLIAGALEYIFIKDREQSGSVLNTHECDASYLCTQPSVQLLDLQFRATPKRWASSPSI